MKDLGHVIVWGNFIGFLKGFVENGRGDDIVGDLDMEAEKPTKSILDRGYLFLLDRLGKTYKVSLVFIEVCVFLVGIIIGFLV